MLRDADNETALKLVKYLLKQFDKNGQLVKLMMELVRDNPKEFIHKATDVSNFNVAKLGGVKKIEKILEKHPIFDKDD